MRSLVRFMLEDDREIELEPGDLVGRMPGCALRIEDPRISEAHAMVSRRREGLVLLSLRGRLSVDGKPKTRIVLTPDTRIILSGFFPLVVTTAECPSTRLAVVALPLANPPVVAALARVVSLYAEMRREPVTWFDPEAEAHVLGGTSGPRLRIPGAPDRPLRVDETFAVGGAQFRLALIDQAKPDAVSTSDRGHLDVSLKITARYDTVLIASDIGKSVTLDGIAARMLTELAEIKAPVAWAELARHLWNAPPDAATRHRWDQLLVRVRGKLREAGIRTDLIRSNRSGLVELVLGPLDKLLLRS
jgi:hypothetical protein